RGWECGCSCGDALVPLCCVDLSEKYLISQWWPLWGAVCRSAFYSHRWGCYGAGRIWQARRVNDSLTLIVYILFGVLILGGVLAVLLRGPKAPKEGYEGTRDADDLPADSADGPVTTIERPA